MTILNKKLETIKNEELKSVIKAIIKTAQLYTDDEIEIDVEALRNESPKIYINTEDVNEFEIWDTTYYQNDLFYLAQNGESTWYINNDEVIRIECNKANSFTYYADEDITEMISDEYATIKDFKKVIEYATKKGFIDPDDAENIENGKELLWYLRDGLTENELLDLLIETNELDAEAGETLIDDLREEINSNAVDNQVNPDFEYESKEYGEISANIFGYDLNIFFSDPSKNDITIENFEKVEL